jgi:hypothetical protein
MSKSEKTAKQSHVRKITLNSLFFAVAFPFLIAPSVKTDYAELFSYAARETLRAASSEVHFWDNIETMSPSAAQRAPLSLPLDNLEEPAAKTSSDQTKKDVGEAHLATYVPGRIFDIKVCRGKGRCP